ncbi:hypothetical protein D3C86_1024750 [compost metagenome]
MSQRHPRSKLRPAAPSDPVNHRVEVLGVVIHEKLHGGVEDVKCGISQSLLKPEPGDRRISGQDEVID